MLVRALPIAQSRLMSAQDPAGGPAGVGSGSIGSGSTVGVGSGTMGSGSTSGSVGVGTIFAGTTGTTFPPPPGVGVGVGVGVGAGAAVTVRVPRFSVSV